MKNKNLQCQPEFGQVWLDQLVDKSDTIVRVADMIDWDAIERDLRQYFPSDMGAPCASFRLVVGLLLLKHMYGHSDDEVLDLWRRDPYYQYFCGGEVYVRRFPISRPTLSNWRKRLGEEGADRILEASVELAKLARMIGDDDFLKLICDTTPTEKNIAHPTDGGLYDAARRLLARLALAMGILVSDEHDREAKRLNVQARRLCRRKDRGPFNETLAEMRGNVRSLIAEILGKLDAVPDRASRRFMEDEIKVVERVLTQRRKDKNKILSMHERDVACMFSGKPGKRYGYGHKNQIAATHRMQIVTAIRALDGAPYDGHSLEEILRVSERITGVVPETAFADRGYRGHNARSAKVCIAGMHKGLSEEDIEDLKKRSRIEASIGYMKQSGHLGRCRLKGRLGDSVNAVLCGAAYNVRKVMIWLEKEPALQS